MAEEQKTGNKVDLKVKITKKMVHDDEVNRVRYMPQKSHIIATQTNNGEVHIFDVTAHPNVPEDGKKARPQIRLVGHTQEGYGISWNPQAEGSLLTGSYDSSICLWNIESKQGKGKQVDPLQ